MDEEGTETLPAAYRWAETADGATLFERYGCAATVTPTSFKVAASGIDGAITGPCCSVAHGKRIVERIVGFRLCLGTPERAAFRERLRRARIHRLNPPKPMRPDDDADWRYP